MTIRLSRLLPLAVLAFIFFHGKTALSKRVAGVGNARQSFETRQRMGVIVGQVALASTGGEALPFRDAASLRRFIKGGLRTKMGGGDLSVDAWGRPYTYRTDGARFTLISAGPDGKYQTSDDITASTTLDDY